MEIDSHLIVRHSRKEALQSIRHRALRQEPEGRTNFGTYAPGRPRLSMRVDPPANFKQSRFDCPAHVPDFFPSTQPAAPMRNCWCGGLCLFFISCWQSPHPHAMRESIKQSGFLEARQDRLAEERWWRRGVFQRRCVVSQSGQPDNKSQAKDRLCH